MTQRQRGYADNYAGVRRTPGMSLDWLAGWDEAQNDRLQDPREIRRVVIELQNQQGNVRELENIFDDTLSDNFSLKPFSC